jgi:primosomal protein N' (replication factor Y)
MFYKIFVNTKLKIKQPFIYSSNSNLNIGDVVLVPFGKKSLIGIVVDKIETKDSYNFEIKKIIENLNDTYLKLSITELRIIKYLIIHYNSMINHAINLYLTKKVSLVNNLEKEKTARSESISKLTPKQEVVYNDYFSINKSQHINKFILYGVTGSGKTEIYIKIIKDYLKKNKQVLLLVPDITLTSQIYIKIQKEFGGDNIAIMHSKIQKKHKGIENNLISLGMKNIVIGSRSAIFSRFKDLGLIIIDEFHDISYKQDQDPRYDTIKLAEYITEINNTQLILGSATPRIDIYYRYLNNNGYKIISLDEKFHYNEAAKVKLDIIDLKEEKENGNNSIFSKKLQSEIINSLKQNKKSILYINRRGFSPILLCNNCGHIEECPRCEIPLNIHKDKGLYNLYCHHCEYIKNIANLLCSNCGNKEVKFYGFGTQYIAEELEKIFLLEKKNIFILDKDYKTNNEFNNDQEIYKILNNKDIKIIIGTQLIVKGWDLNNIHLIGILSADLDFSFPDYKGYENSYQKLSQLIGRIGRKGLDGKVILQTYDTENKIIELLKNNNYVDLYNYEIISRKKFNYPPFCEMIKITIKSKSEKTLNLKSMNIYQKIKEEKLEGIQIYLPTSGFPYKKNYIYRKNIILKIFNDGKNVKKFLRKTFMQENGVIIDIEPSTLI